MHQKPFLELHSSRRKVNLWNSNSISCTHTRARTHTHRQKRKIRFEGREARNQFTEDPVKLNARIGWNRSPPTSNLIPGVVGWLEALRKRDEKEAKRQRRKNPKRPEKRYCRHRSSGGSFVATYSVVNLIVRLSKDGTIGRERVGPFTGSDQVSVRFSSERTFRKDRLGQDRWWNV